MIIGVVMLETWKEEEKAKAEEGTVKSQPVEIEHEEKVGEVKEKNAAHEYASADKIAELSKELVKAEANLK